MIKNLADAKRYIDNVKKGLIKNPFATRDHLDSLKIFAKEKDEKNFKIIVESMSNAILTQKGYKLFKKEPLALIEVFCMTIDHGGDKVSYNAFQAQRGLKTKRLPIGKTQKFFQRIYGNHFFKK